MAGDINLARLVAFERRLIEEDEDIWFDVYKKIDEQNPNFPTNPFPVGCPREVVRSTPTFVKMGGREVQAPTIEALIAKIVRAYESTRTERWNEFTRKEKEGPSVRDED